MNIESAFEMAMEHVESLRDDGGIQVRMVPSRGRNIPKMRHKYCGPDRLPVNKWFHVQFYPTDSEQREKIAIAAKILSWRGIHFDTGGCAGERDWELDWSFRCTGVPDGDREVAMDAVEQLLVNDIEGDVQ